MRRAIFTLATASVIILLLPRLAEGQHELTLTVTTRTGPTYQQPYQTTKTIVFFINTTAPSLNPTPSPTPTIPEFPATLAITFLLMTALAVSLSFRRLKAKDRCNLLDTGELV